MSSRVPANAEAERTVLGAILVEPTALSSAAAVLRRQHFHSEQHRVIYGAMLDMVDMQRSVDLVTLKDELAARGHLESAGGAVYLAGLLDGLPRLSNVDEWALIVQEKAILRRVIQAAGRVLAAAQDEGARGSEVLDRAYTEIMNAADDSVQETFHEPEADLQDAMDYIGQLSQAKGGLTGLTTGLRDLDAMLGGLMPGDLIVLAARPSMGKTALALNIGEAVVRKGGSVGMFSLEMTRKQLSTRRLCSEARVSTAEVRGNGSDRAWARLAKTWDDLRKRAFYVDDTFTTTVSQIAAKARRLKMRTKQLDLVIVDYMQLIQGDGEDNRQLEVAAISRGLKGLAKSLGVPVLALSQLSRAGAGQSGKARRPQLSDLRDSGAIEQDADVVVFIHRESEIEETDENRGIADLIVAKQRNGPTDTVRAAFIKDHTRFEDLAVHAENMFA